MCAKHPWMGHTQIRTGLRILQQLQAASCCVRQDRASPASHGLHGRHYWLTSHNPMTKINELTAEDKMEKWSVSLYWEETTQVISIAFLRLCTQKAPYFCCSSLLWGVSSGYTSVTTLEENDNERINKSRPETGYDDREHVILIGHSSPFPGCCQRFPSPTKPSVP